MRLKARACGIDAEDYHTDQLLDDINLLARGYHQIEGSFWDRASRVETRQLTGQTLHDVQLVDNLPALHINDFILDEQGFVGQIKAVDGVNLQVLDMHREPLLHQEPGACARVTSSRHWPCMRCSTRISIWST